MNFTDSSSLTQCIFLHNACYVTNNLNEWTYQRLQCYNALIATNTSTELTSKHFSARMALTFNIILLMHSTTVTHLCACTTFTNDINL